MNSTRDIPQRVSSVTNHHSRCTNRLCGNPPGIPVRKRVAFLITTLFVLLFRSNTSDVVRGFLRRTLVTPPVAARDAPVAWKSYLAIPVLLVTLVIGLVLRLRRHERCRNKERWGLLHRVPARLWGRLWRTRRTCRSTQRHLVGTLRWGDTLRACSQSPLKNTCSRDR